MIAIQKATHELVGSRSLDFETTKEVMDEIISGNVTQVRTSLFLTAPRMKRETIDEITAYVTVTHNKAVKLSSSFLMVDIVGTEGGEVGTFNISVASAFVAATRDIWVAKHGNCSVSSESDAADILERLGTELVLTTEQAKTILEDAGMCFLFAPAYHSSMKYTAPVREEIGVGSIFSILGPLSSPAGASIQLLGVYSQDLVEPLTQVLANLGATRRMVVCGGDRLDEAILTGPTHVYKIHRGKVTTHDMTPEELDLTVCNLEELIGGTPEEDAQIARNILSGSLKGPKRGIVASSAAISLYLGIDDCTARDYVKTVQDTIGSGTAMAKMEELIQVTKRATGEARAP